MSVCPQCGNVLVSEDDGMLYCPSCGNGTDIDLIHPDLEWKRYETFVPTKCTCGRDKTGAGKHSTWCDKWLK